MSRASTSFLNTARKTWTAGTSPAMTASDSVLVELIRRGLVEVDPDLAVLHDNLIGPQRREARRLDRFAGLDVECAEMQRTLDHIALQHAVGKTRRAVGAFVVGGVELTADVVDGDDIGADLEALHRVLRHLRGRTDGHKLSHSHVLLKADSSLSRPRAEERTKCASRSMGRPILRDDRCAVSSG